MDNSTRVATVAFVVLCLVTSVGLAAASNTGTLELEAAESGDSDTTTLSYSFTAQGNGTATVSPTSDSQSAGDVTFTLQSSESFTVEAGQSYTVEYEVTAQDGAREGTYDLFSSVSGPSGSYSETLSVDVEVLEPQFDSVDSQDGEVSFTTDSTASTTIDVDVDNRGDGVMTGVSASTNGVPSGMDVDVSTPSEIGAGDTETVEVDVSAEESLSEGAHSFTVTVEDSLGNTESFTVTIDVIKAPVLTADDRDIDLGDVLIGESVSGDFILEESGGYEDVNGVQVVFDNQHPDGEITLSGVDGYIEANGERVGTVTISPESSAQQHTDLSWDATLRPDDPDGTGTTILFTARVIYPPYYESVSAPDRTIAFDEPRAQQSEFSNTVPVTIENGGDRPMDISSVTPTITGSEMTATVVDAPDTIPGQSSRTVEVRVTADADSDPGDRRMNVAVDAQEAGQERTSATISVEHETEIDVETTDIAYGRVVATRTATRNIAISERLGYNDIENFDIRLVSGPQEGWLTLAERPDSLAAGETSPLVTSLTFDTRAQFFTQYTWEYRITGDNIETQTITVTATPRPVDFTATVDDLRAAESNGDNRHRTVASETASAMEELTTEIREDSSQQARNDVTTVSAAGRSTALFLRYTIDARQQMDAGNHTAAQRSLTRAAATYNTLASASGRVQTPAARTRLDRAAGTAEEILTELLDEQRGHYEQRLASNDTTMLERAQTTRQLAQLAALAGDDSEAERLEAESQSAFSNYSTLVSDGNANLQSARQDQANLTAGTLLTVGGRPVYWIGNLDGVERQQSAVVESYTQAEQQFESAGASSRAQTAQSERMAFSQRMEQGRLLSFGLAGFVVVAFITGLGLEARAIYRYVQDSTEAVRGDFLLANDTA
ncbi:hypothetical protein [Haloarcula sp. H-GB5]